MLSNSAISMSLLDQCIPTQHARRLPALTFPCSIEGYGDKFFVSIVANAESLYIQASDEQANIIKFILPAIRDSTVMPDYVPPAECFDAGTFEQYVLQEAHDLLARCHSLTYIDAYTTFEEDDVLSFEEANLHHA